MKVIYFICKIYIPKELKYKLYTVFLNLRSLYNKSSKYINLFIDIQSQVVLLADSGKDNSFVFRKISCSKKFQAPNGS